MFKQAYKKTKIDTAIYSNNTTGEVLQSELDGEKSKFVRSKIDGKWEVDSKNYLTIDIDALTNVSKYLTPVELDKLMTLCKRVDTGMNFVYLDDGSIANRKDLASILGVSQGRVNVILPKFIMLNVVYVLSGYNGRNKVRRIVINPSLARRRRFFDNDCITNFMDLTSQKYVNDMKDWADTMSAIKSSKL